MTKHVSDFVNLTALDRRLPAKGRADHLGQRLRAIDGTVARTWPLGPLYVEVATAAGVTIGFIALIAAVVIWIAVTVVYLGHRIVQSSDSMNNYVHVWWIARDLWHHGRLPWAMPVTLSIAVTFTALPMAVNSK